MAVLAPAYPVTIPMLAPISHSMLLSTKRNHYGVCGLNLGPRMAGSAMVSAGRLPMKLKGASAALCCSYRPPITAVSSSIRDQFSAHLESDPFKDFGLSRSHFGKSSIPELSSRRALRTGVSQASNALPYYLTHPPPREEKPMWWWRTLSCIPYLMPLHMMSMYANGALPFLPFLGNLQDLGYVFGGTIFPVWFPMIYTNLLIFFVVRRKEWWPYFFRFHVDMALLFDTMLTIVVLIARMLPYWRKLDAPFWTVFACEFLVAVGESMRRALVGEYPEIPLFSEASHIHTHLL